MKITLKDLVKQFGEDAEIYVGDMFDEPMDILEERNWDNGKIMITIV